MIKQFTTFESAALYAAKKREEGFFAEILDEGTGFLYGQIATGGFRVTISEFAADEEEDPPVHIPDKVSSVDQLFRYAFVVFLGAGVLAFLGLILKTYEKTSLKISSEFFVSLLAIVAVVLFGMCMGKTIPKLFFVANTSAHKWQLVAKIIIALIAIVLIFL